MPKEFECPICFKLLYKPVTTACGHNFCKVCLDQVTTRHAICPLCRAPLSLEYGTNTLLWKIIRDMFEEQLQTRETEELEALQAEEAAYMATCSSDEKGSLPVIFYEGSDRPLFRGEEYSLVVNSVEMSRMIRFALTREGRLIRIKHGEKKDMGTILKMVNNVAQVVARDDKLPYVVNTVVTDRVLLEGQLIGTPYSWVTSNYKVMQDEFELPDSSDQNEAEALEALHETIMAKSFSGESLLQEYRTVVELSTMNLTKMDRYKLFSALLKICNIVAKRQLNACSADARVIFATRFEALPVVHDMPTSKELETSSMFHARLLAASNEKKWDWYRMRDPMQRILEVARIYAYSGDACILKLEWVP